MSTYHHGLVPKFHHGLVEKSAHAPTSKGLTHPAGKVTGIDESSGLPIVRRDAAHSPTDSHNSPIGKEEPKTGRDILHVPNDEDEIAAKVKAEHQGIKDRLHKAIAPIKGAKIHGSRDEKPEERVDEKIQDEGQNPRTIPDFSGFRVAVDSHDAHKQAADAIRKNFNVVREKDEFENGAPDTSFHAHMMQVQQPGSDVSHEVQVLPKQVADTAESTHDLYEKARTGDKGAAETMKGKNEASWQDFQKGQNKISPHGVKSDLLGTLPASSKNQNSGSKGGRGESPEQPKAGAAGAPAKVQVRTGITVKLPDGRTGVVKGISPKGEVEVKLAAGGRARANKSQVTVVDPNGPVKGVTAGTPGHDKPTPGSIAVDLDRTIAQFDTYKGASVIGAPIPEEVEHVKQLLSEGKDVWIYTARAKDPEAIPAIKAWTRKNIGEELPITNIKFPEFGVFIDDRAQLPVQMQKGGQDASSQRESEEMAVHA